VAVVDQRVKEIMQFYHAYMHRFTSDYQQVPKQQGGSTPTNSKTKKKLQTGGAAGAIMTAHGPHSASGSLRDNITLERTSIVSELQRRYPLMDKKKDDDRGSMEPVARISAVRMEVAAELDRNLSLDDGANRASKMRTKRAGY